MKIKKHFTLATLLAAVALFAACSTEDGSTSGTSGSDASASSSTSGDLGSSELMSFTVAIDRTSAEPGDYAEAGYPSDEDNLDDDSNSGDFTVEVDIDVSNTADGTVNGVSITHDGANIVCNHGSNKVCYILSGTTTTGSVTITGEKKCKVVLDGVSISSPDSAALNILCKKRCFLCLNAGTANTLADKSTGSGDYHKGALYCKGKLLFYGSGSLEVQGNYNNAIHSADYIIFNPGNNVYAKSTANNAIKANDGIYINGGIINAETSATAAKAISSEADIIINGGRTTCITSGAGAYDSDEGDAKGAAGIKADIDITVNAGEVYLYSSGSGGKGMSADGIITFAGGTVYALTTGSQYKYSSSITASPKGIKGDDGIEQTGGAIMVRCTGQAGEGIESKSTLDITAGSMSVYSAQDDAINAASTLTISGGYVLGYSSGNDGIDANGNFYVKGGTTYAISAGGAEVGLDANTEEGYKLYVQGGTLVAIGGLENGASLSQSCWQTSWSKNTWYALSTGSNILCFKTPSSGGTTLVVSSASTPSLLSGVTVSSGTTCFGGLGYTGATVSGGSTASLTSYTASSSGHFGR